MHRIVKKTLQYTGFLFLSLIVLLLAGISYLYFSADMQTPKHEQSMTTDKVIDIDSLHLRYYGDNFLRHSDSGLWELFVKGDAFQRGEAIGKLSSDLLHYQEKVFVDQIREIVPSDLSLIHISEPTRLGMISYAVFCLKKKKPPTPPPPPRQTPTSGAVSQPLF